MRELRNLGQEVYEHVIVADDASSYTKVEQLTREQSQTPTRDLFRAGRITASKVHAVLTRRNTTDPNNLTCRVLGYCGHFTTPATQWGLDTEAEALAVYDRLTPLECWPVHMTRQDKTRELCCLTIPRSA